MKKIGSKKQKFKPKKLPVPLSNVDYDSMIENGTDEESEDDSLLEEPQNNSDSGHEGGGRFVRAPASDEKKGASSKQNSKKRKPSGPPPADDLAHRQKIKALKQLYKPPTVEEINRLKETENFYHSNLFRLQIEELLAEVKVKAKVIKFVDQWLDSFRKVLRTIKDAESEQPLLETSYNSVKFPLEIPENSAFLSKQSFQFRQQRIVHQIGSATLGTQYGKPTVIDLLLEIPEKCLHKEDYLNLRYHYKRAHFLCHLADGLMNQTKYGMASRVCFVSLKGDPLKPVLELVPADEKFAEKVRFRIWAAATEKFAPKRFHPSKNNVRPALIGNDDTDASELTATPHYNSSILFDMRLLKNHEILESTLQSEQIRQAIVLLKVWTRQRRFDEGYYGFDGALVTFFVVYLLQTHKLYNSMSCYQVIRLFWNLLSNSKWDTEGISMETGAPVGEFRKCFEVVFLDNSGLLNLCANLSGDLYRRIRQEAAVAIQLLDNQKANSFVPLFLNKFPVYTQYDHILSIDKSVVIRSIVDTFGSDEDKLNYFGNTYGHFRNMVYKLLNKGLGTRASYIVPIELNQNSALHLTMGILLNPQEAFRTLDKGPEAIDKEASEEFRQFWRGKAELRRFKDGSITESCVWGESSDPIGEKRLICRKIALYLLNSHFDVPETQVTYSAQQFEASVRPKNADMHETVEQRALACIRTFDNLARIIKNLDGLPLTINAILGTDAVFRYSDPDPPSPTAKALLVNDQLMFLAPKVMCATIQLEASGRWPDDLEAIRKLKAAFYLKIAESLRVHAGKTAELVPQAYADYLDVLYEKYLFRLHIFHNREITLMREYLAENKVTRLYRDSDASIQLEMKATILPKLTAILHGLHQQFFSFGSVAAMAKRWLCSQLIDSHLWPDECTELLVASLYLRQDPTIQPQAGFLRFLEYLANTDWSKELVLLNFNDEIPEEKVEELEKQFIEARESFPPLAIITSCDADKFGLFSKRAPSPEVLNRVTMLAQIVIEKMENNFNTVRNKVHIFYQPSFDGYDLLLHLDTTIVPDIGITSIDLLSRGKREDLFDLESKDPAAGFDPVRFYLQELREAYGSFAIFFYDTYGGDRIAVLWRPDALEEKPFTTTHINGRILSKAETLHLNTEALIRDFEILGKGLVLKVERKISSDS
ncbi:nucleolar protein 6 [Uranotaenia lowii]|uniref:nucleolar protein 6 n=1 Tax=Uranotaenia lowii TaxID=190385 RepID=UPI00247972C0|nr:nucleolar protein 6 [Uranotaenia lowii]